MPPTPVPASPLLRAARAAGSLLVLAGLAVGLPLALALLAGNPLPDGVPTMEAIGSALTSPDDGTLFLAVLTVVGWLAWAMFTGSVVIELIARIGRRRAPAIRGLGGPQRLATILVAAIAALAVTPTVASASAAVVDTGPAITAPVDPSAAERAPARAAAGGSDTVLHLVERGEGLLDLQDRYGVAWHRIAEANYGATQPDGRSLQQGQTRIYPGWQLRIPTSAAPGAVEAEKPPRISGLGSADRAAAATSLADSTAQPMQYEIAEGDWLWHVAERYLGDPERYDEIAALNPQYADRHGDFPDHIEPVWTLQLPADAVDRGPVRHATGSAAPDGETDPGGPSDARPGEIDPGGDPPLPPEPPPDQADQPPADPAGPDSGAAGPEPGVAGSEPEAAGSEPDAAGPESGAPAPGPARFGAAAPDPTGPGERTPAPSPTAPADPGERTPARSPAAPPGSGEAGEADITGLGAAPDEPADGFGLGGEPDLERLAPAAFAGAGLLTALALGAAALHQHRRHQHHRPGFRFASPAARRLEKALRAAQQPLDSGRLDAALRSLAAGLAGRTGPLPDIAGALVDEGSVHLLLAGACPDPPAPWRDHGDRWTLPAGAALPPPGPAPLAALPTLATIGSQAGIHLLLDLERLGYLTVYGDPLRAVDLLRYLAAELACNTWSDSTEVLIAGFDPGEAELLAAVNPDRVRTVGSIPDAVALLRHRIASARATLGHTGAADAFDGRVNRVAGDAWMPQVLLAMATSAADLAALAALEAELDGRTRCAVAVATTDTTPPPPDQWRITVTPDGVIHVRLPFLRASLAAAALSVEELVPLAETMRAARAAPPVPVPAAPEPAPWAADTDAAGSPASTAASYPASADDRDPHLDADLQAWLAGDPARPRIGILGPITLDAPGVPPEARRRLHAELVVFLAQRAGLGADGAAIDAALWPDLRVTEAARQLTISRARRWLGTAPDGTAWLPDIAADLAYRLADGYLLDWHLFRRLRTRGEARGPAGADDLRAALRLVRGVPLAGADQPAAPGTRNPYPWLPESAIEPGHLVATVVDTAHVLAEHCLAAGDPAGVRWAVDQVWLADPGRSYDQPWQDLLRAEHADGQTGALRAVLAELMEVREAEAPEDLAPDTFRLISCWPPHVLVPAS